jgi:phosphopantetheine adenylyltransferase
MLEEHQLLVVDVREAVRWTGIVRHLLKPDSKRPLLVHFLGEGEKSARVSSSKTRLLKSDVVRLLTALYENVARVDPRACVTPLLESCGWDLTRIVAEQHIWDIKEVHYAQKSTELWAQKLRAEYRKNKRGVGLKLVPSWSYLDGIDGIGIQKKKACCSKEPGSGCSTSYDSMDDVCVGGTFDRLHAGHRTLLAATVAVCNKTIYLGITSEVLLVKKRNRDLLEPFRKRKESVLAFIHKMNPNLEVHSGELDDKPPLAVTSERMDGIVVSRETVGGAAWINQEREASGFKPIAIIAVNLIGAMEQSQQAKKLSSSDLREDDSSKANKKQKQEAASGQFEEDKCK